MNGKLILFADIWLRAVIGRLWPTRAHARVERRRGFGKAGDEPLVWGLAFEQAVFDPAAPAREPAFGFEQAITC